MRGSTLVFALAPLLLGASVYAERTASLAQTAASSPSAAAATAAPGSREAARFDADPEAARSFIESANRSWCEAYRRGDTRAMAEIYSPDASLSLGSSATLEGRASIIEYFAGQHSLGAGAPSLETLDVVTIGDVAYEIGTYGMPPGSDGASGDSGRYVAIWKSHEDGWRCQLGIWTSVVPVSARP